MNHRRYQLGCALAACVIGVVGTVCARQGLWVPTFVLGFGALFFVDLSIREARAHRAAVRPRAALNHPVRPTDPNDPATGPCCAVSARFGATSHDTHCTGTDHAA